MFQTYGLLLLFASIAVATEVQKCGTNGTLPISVNVKDCDKPPCNFVRSKDVIAYILLDIEEDVEELKAKVKAFTLGMSTDYPLPHSNVCECLTDAECPIDKGEQVTYLLQMPVLPEFPKLSVRVEFSFVSGKGNLIACFSITGNVVDP